MSKKNDQGPEHKGQENKDYSSEATKDLADSEKRVLTVDENLKPF